MAPSALLADTPQFPRIAGYMRRLRCADRCRPRPSASSSELSLPFLLSMSPSNAPGESADCAHPVLRRRGSPSSSALLDSALSTPHFNPLHVESTFGVSWFAHSLQPAELLASLADLTRHSLPSQRRLLLPSFRPSRSPFSPSDISTVASGHLHRQDSHLLERQLASLHERGGFELSGDFTRYSPSCISSSSRPQLLQLKLRHITSLRPKIYSRRRQLGLSQAS